MTRMQHRLVDLIQEIAKEEGTDEQGALRDIMTDFRHVSEMYVLDVDKAAEESKAVHVEEVETGCNSRVHM
jgi:SOS-response transcriptional repressor LexA